MTNRNKAGRVAGLQGVAVLIGAMALAGCNTDTRVVRASPLIEYQKVHPIVLVDSDKSLEVFAAGGSGDIGARQISDVRTFAMAYRQMGRGPLTVAVPSSRPDMRNAAASVRRALAEGGVTRAVVTSYEPADPREPAPIRLSYDTLKAAVATQCGRWPSDLSGAGGTVDGFENRHWENFGCSTQQYMAEQVADPLDLVRGRTTGPASGARQALVLKKYGAGESTAVQYPAADAGKINEAVAK